MDGPEEFPSEVVWACVDFLDKCNTATDAFIEPSDVIAYVQRDDQAWFYQGPTAPWHYRLRLKMKRMLRHAA